MLWDDLNTVLGFNVQFAYSYNKWFEPRHVKLEKYPDFDDRLKALLLKCGLH